MGDRRRRWPILAALGGWIPLSPGAARKPIALGLGGILAAMGPTGCFAAKLPVGVRPCPIHRMPSPARPSHAHPGLGAVHTGLGQEDARASGSAALDAETDGTAQACELVETNSAAVRIGAVGQRGRAIRATTPTNGALLAHRDRQAQAAPALSGSCMDRAGNAVQALKPCFMMSPMSVAQYLRPGGLRFDLLVIDEASQMRPEDARGCHRPKRHRSSWSATRSSCRRPRSSRAPTMGTGDDDAVSEDG